MRFTVRQLMVAVLIAGGLSWFSFNFWNRKYTTTIVYEGFPTMRGTYRRTYGNWILERLGMSGGNWNVTIAEDN
jgi:hypothetical protein